MEAKPEKYFPEDIAAEVLVRLPVKSLIRFTVICKSWYSLIKNPSFISAHLNRNLSKQEDPYFLSVHNRLAFVIYERTLAVREYFELPYGFAHKEIVGSCNGLLCLKIIYGTGQGIFLYNPSIRHLKFIECFRDSELINSQPEVGFYGFGYNEQSGDHRLVKIQGNNVLVYSLGTDSWHEVKQISPPRKLEQYRCRGSTGLYFNGATHWWTSKVFDDEIFYLYYLDSIVAFDFNEEIFREITLPGELQVDMDDFVQINEFHGSLALLVMNRFSLMNHDESTTSDLWVMEEYGVSESWKKKFSHDFSLSNEPTGFTKNGSFFSKSTVLIKDIFDFVDSLLLLDYENVLEKYQSGNDLFYWNLE